MARFEQRISDEEVMAARRKITAGTSSLRAAAAEIPCAPSTLSRRIKKAEEAEAQQRDRAGIGESEQRPAQGAAEDASPGAIAGRDGAAPGQVGPVETLRGALLATRASGEPDWPTRVSAAKALAVLRPAEVAPKDEGRREAQIVVYDLEPGAVSVLHRAREGRGEAPLSDEALAEELLTQAHMFFYHPAEGEGESIGQWLPPSDDQSPGAVFQVAIQTTDDRETAERWRAELAAGGLPQTPEDEPEDEP